VTLLSAIQNRILLFDGAMSTMLQQSGLLHPRECAELFNATRPMDILDIHTAYLNAGADIMTANTFGCSPLRLSRFGLQERMEELMQSGVSLCREVVSGRDRAVFVAASIGPSGELYHSDPAMPQRMYDSFFQQCAAAEAAGADALLIETMIDLSEARLALLAARAATSLPVLVSFTLEPDDNTYAGNPPEVLALCSARLGASLCGVNCGLGPEELFDGYSRLAGASPLPTFAMPNAGALANGRYGISPDEMSRRMEAYLHGGAVAIGGCCGTTPAHISALRTLLDGFHGNARQAAPDTETICSAAVRLPMSQLEPFDPLLLFGLSPVQAADRIRAVAQTRQPLHIDFSDYEADAIHDLLFTILPDIRLTPLAFHVHSAEQAHAALFLYPGIAAVYAHSDAYNVHKAAARYGAEVVE
jgi:5-methyltetrahydrofolate--homocysteine methyltransferase